MKFYALIFSFLLFIGNIAAQLPPMPLPLPLPNMPLPLGIPESIIPTAQPTDPNVPTQNTNNTSDNTSENTSDNTSENTTSESTTAEDMTQLDAEIKFDVRQEELPQAKIWGQQFFRDQSIILFTGSRDIKAIDKYILGTGDELAVTVWGRTDYSASVQVDEDGFIDLSNPQRGTHIPRLYLKGMKFSNARKALISRLKNHMNINNSQVAIKLNYSKSLTVNITGEVFHPGSYTIPSVNTAFNALVAAGGPSQIGSVRLIKVVSSEKEERILDVYEFMNNPKITDEFFLSNNDYIYVPLADRVVEISGAIERPFFYELIKNENLTDLIRHAGGLRPDAYKRNIQIIRYEGDEEKLIDVNLTELYEKGLDLMLKDGDRITISSIKQAFANYVTVSGAVKIPGTYQITSASTVYEVLKKAGITRSAIKDRIYIKRLREDLSVDYIAVDIYEVLSNPTSPKNLLLNPFDELEVKFKADFIDKYKIHIFGSVREPGEFDYSDSLVLSDVIYMANGIQMEAMNSIIEISRLELDVAGNRTYVTFKVFDINKDLTIEGASEFKLKPYDQIFVRKSKEFEVPKNVYIGGEILLPGNYTIADKNERILDLLERCGGVTTAAFLQGGKLFRQGEGLVLLDLEKLLDEGEVSKFNYILKANDRIIIPPHRNLVSISGRVNHPFIKDTAEIEAMRLAVDLELLELDAEKQELLLEREIKRRINPPKINIPYHEGKRALFYIREYGAGIDRKLGGRNRLVYVRYANGAVKKARGFLFFKKYPIVEKGATVYVDQKTIKPRKQLDRTLDWYAVVRDGFAIATAGLTIFALSMALSKK